MIQDAEARPELARSHRGQRRRLTLRIGDAVGSSEVVLDPIVRFGEGPAVAFEAPLAENRLHVDEHDRRLGPVTRLAAGSRARGLPRKAQPPERRRTPSVMGLAVRKELGVALAARSW